MGRFQSNLQEFKGWAKVRLPAGQLASQPAGQSDESDGKQISLYKDIQQVKQTFNKKFLSTYCMQCFSKLINRKRWRRQRRRRWRRGGGGGGGGRREKNEREGRNRRKGGNYMINCGFGVSCNNKLNFIKKLLQVSIVHPAKISFAYLCRRMHS